MKFLGVFDTVGALGRRGLNSSERTHNMWLSPRVSFARHALDGMSGPRPLDGAGASLAS